MQAQNLVGMGVIALIHPDSFVLEQMVERRDRPAAVEGPVTVGQDQEEMPTWAAHPPPFTQGR